MNNVEHWLTSNSICSATVPKPIDHTFHTIFDMLRLYSEFSRIAIAFLIRHTNDICVTQRVKRVDDLSGSVRSDWYTQWFAQQIRREMALKWGIVSVGLISQDFANAVNTLNAVDHKLVAVAARDLARAEKFAEKFGVSKAYSSYLELAQDPNVEIAYVGTLNPWHYEVSVLMLEHGKHVLCEKPLCMNFKQSEKLIALAKAKGVFFMEGLWCRFFPAYQHVRKEIRSGVLGDILSVEAEFGVKDLKEVARLSKKAMGGGTILDMGVYTIQACQWVLEKEPISIKAKGILNEEGVDLEMSADLDYGDGKKVQIKTSALNQLSNAVKIVGTKGKITINEIFCSTRIIDIDGKEKHWPLPPAKYDFYYPNSCGLRYEADEIRKAIRAGKKEHENAPHTDSLGIARVQDELRRQLGVHYEGHDD